MLGKVTAFFASGGLPAPQASYYADIPGSLTIVSGAISQWRDQSGNNRHLSQSTPGNRPLYKTDSRNGNPLIQCDANLTLAAAAGVFDFLHQQSTTVVFVWRSRNLVGANPATPAIFFGTSQGSTSKGMRVLIPSTASGAYNQITTAISDGATDVISQPPNNNTFNMFPGLLWNVAGSSTTPIGSSCIIDNVESYANAFATALPSGAAANPLSIGNAQVEFQAIEVYSPALTNDQLDTAIAKLAARFKVPQVSYLARASGQTLNPTPPTRYDAFSCWDLAANGNAVAVWRDGTTHASDIGKIIERIGTWSLVNGIPTFSAWSAPVTLYDGASTGVDPRDPCIAKLSTNDLLLTFFLNDSINSNTAYLRTMRSTDNGVTWGPVQIVTGPTTQWQATSGPVVEFGGALYWPLYCQNIGDAHSSAWVLKSTDHGVTWPTAVKVADGVTDAVDYQEPNLVVLPGGGTMLMVIRMGNNTPAVEVTTNDGTTWSAVSAGALRANGAPRMCTTADGTVVALSRQISLSEACFFRRLGAAHWSGGWPSIGDTDYPQGCDALFSLMVYGQPREISPGWIGGIYSVNLSTNYAETRFRVWPVKQIQALDQPAVAIAPTTATVSSGNTQSFVGSNGVTPRVFSIPADSNNSGATINPTTGLYTAGPTPSVHDFPIVTDYWDEIAQANVTVPALWDPTHLTGLKLWLDPTVGVTGNPITAWTDSSGAGHNYSGSGGVTPTTNIAGQPTVTGDGTTGYFLPTNAALRLTDFVSAGAWMIGCVFQDEGLPAPSGTYYLDPCVWGDATGTGGFLVMSIATGQASVGQIDAGHPGGVAVTATFGAGPHYMIAWYDGVNINLQVDGGVVHSAAVGNISNITASPLRTLRNEISALYTKADIRDIFVSNAAPSAGDRNSANTWLAGRA